jgi:hypothetical protein
VRCCGRSPEGGVCGLAVPVASGSAGADCFRTSRFEDDCSADAQADEAGWAEDRFGCAAGGWRVLG